jgi:hypothetical protein
MIARDYTPQVRPRGEERTERAQGKRPRRSFIDVAHSCFPRIRKPALPCTAFASSGDGGITDRHHASKDIPDGEVTITRRSARPAGARPCGRSPASPNHSRKHAFPAIGPAPGLPARARGTRVASVVCANRPFDGDPHATIAPRSDSSRRAVSRCVAPGRPVVQFTAAIHGEDAGHLHWPSSPGSPGRVHADACARVGGHA